MMDGNTTLLSVHACSQRGSRTEQNTYFTSVHLLDDFLTFLLTTCILHEVYLILRNAILLHQTVFQFLIGRPLTFLRSREIAEHKLCTTIFFVFLVILTDILCSYAKLSVITLRIEVFVDQLRRKRGFLSEVCDDKHLCLHLIIRKIITEDIFRIAAVGKVQQSLGNIIMVSRRRNIDKLRIHLRTLQTDISCSFIICYLIIKSSQLRNLNKLPKSLLHHHLTCHVDLIVTGLSGEDSSPSIKAMYVLCCQSLWTQVLEQQIKLRQRVTDSCS